MIDNVVVRAPLRDWHRLGAVSPLIGRDALARCGLAPPTCGPASGHVGGSRSLAGRRAGRARSAAELEHLLACHELLISCSTTNKDGGRKRKEEETK